MSTDPLLLSRLQFALNISFHILFPTLTIALGWFLVFFKTAYSWTQNERWLSLYFSFTKIFALSFALGVVSGITMSFQFGTNWPGFMNTVGNVAGPLLAYEVLTAFFLEASFLGIMLYGHTRVPPWLHTLSTWLVAMGTTLSAFWILALVSWMHTPAGHAVQDGVVHVTSWAQVLWTPSMPHRLAHTLLSSGITAALVICGVSSWQLLTQRLHPVSQLGLKVGVYALAVLMPLQILVGDLHGKNTAQYQPAKMAAMEGLWKTTAGAGLKLFGWPREGGRVVDYAVELPYVSSFLATGRWDGVVRGLEEFSPDTPPVAPVFWAFRSMVGIGFAVLGLAVWGLWALGRQAGGKPLPKLLLRALVAALPLGWLASLLGWYTTEMGRQPWLVQGLLKTSQALGPLAATPLWGSLLAYGCLYLFLLVCYGIAIRYMASQAILPKNSPSSEPQGPGGVSLTQGPGTFPSVEKIK